MFAAQSLREVSALRFPQLASTVMEHDKGPHEAASLYSGNASNSFVYTVLSLSPLEDAIEG
jgi:hypothetical protein